MRHAKNHTQPYRSYPLAEAENAKDAEKRSDVFGFEDGQRFPGYEGSDPTFEPAQIIVVHDVEYVLIFSEMLVGPVQ